MSRAIRQKGPIVALGAMSGTSLDGVDAAMVETDGVQILGFGASGYRAYSDEQRDVLRAGLGQWTGEAVEAAGQLVTKAHAEALSGFEGAELVGFHGQTLSHAALTASTEGSGVSEFQ